MKLLIACLFFGLFSLGTFGQKNTRSSNLDGWTVYSGDPNFDTSKLEGLGVKDRRAVMKERGKNPKRPYSYDICFSQLVELFPEVKNKDIEEIRMLCSRSLNLKDFVFVEIYQGTYEKKKLVEFRRKMNEIFVP